MSFPVPGRPSGSNPSFEVFAVGGVVVVAGEPPVEPSVFVCDICGGEVPYVEYDDTTCPQCGSAYSYDDGYRISLTADQIEVLRQHAFGIPLDSRTAMELDKARHGNQLFK